MLVQFEVDNAVDEIVNEGICTDEDFVVKIDLDDLPLDDNSKHLINDEFERILKLLDFKFHAYNIFKRWYVDGRLYYDIVIDNKNPELGIQELRYIDPRKIRKIKEVEQKKLQGATNNFGNIDVLVTKNEYYLYNEKGFGGTNKTSPSLQGSSSGGIRIAEDSIIHVPSGLTDVNGNMGIGFLHKCIKILNQLRTIEDSLIIYRLARAPERRVWYIDVGDLPRIKADQYVRDIMVNQRNRLIYDSDTGQVRDDRKFLCFALDTKIPLLDGRTLTLEEIIKEYENGKVNWAYSCDSKTGKFSPGPISWAGITRKNSEVVKVTLDNGKSIICTPDHRFPVWDKGFVEAQNLEIGESIIPGYRRKRKIMTNGNEYEQIYKNDTKTWEFTHREVITWLKENGIKNELTFKNSKEPKTIIHHKDYNRYNNSPENLVLMGYQDHLDYHILNQNIEYTKEIFDRINECAINTMSTEEILHNHKVISVEWLNDKVDVGELTIDKNETYHSNHTYLLDAGIYTKNTMTDDYFLPRRADGSGTRVDTLQGGQTLGQLDDILYFQKQLYGSLNVPVARLNPENSFIMPNATQEVSREEIKFDKFITRLRQQFSLLFTKALERQIVLKGLMTIEEWEELAKDIQYEFARDNPFAEQKDQQILASRLQTLGMIMPFVGTYYSHKWVRRNILKQTDEDIMKITMEIAEEMQDPLYQMAAQQQQGGGEGQDSSEGGNENQQSQGGDEGDNDQRPTKEDEKDERIDNAKHVVQALKDVKKKSPGDIKKLRSASEILAKNTK